MSKIDEIVSEFFTRTSTTTVLPALGKPQYEVEEVHAFTKSEFRAVLVRAAEPQWVSVSERLPEIPDDSSDVPVYTWDGNLVEADDWSAYFDYDANDKQVFIGYFFSSAGPPYSVMGKITHWMPRQVPAPPTEQKGNDL